MANDSVISYPLGPCKNDTEALQFIEDMTSNTDAVQERVLAEILSQNAECEYLQRFGLNGATDHESFKSKIPIITYEDLLSSHPISELLTSSGTSGGERKLMPTIAKEMDQVCSGSRQREGTLLLAREGLDQDPRGLLARPVLSILLREFNTSVVEYTCHADTQTIPAHYVIYWELMARESASSPTDDVLNQCCLDMKESLYSVYRQVADRSIGPLEIRVVKNGTFELLMDYAISRGGSINQYKVPRCVNFKPILKLLDSMVVSVHFSQAEPHWTGTTLLKEVGTK